MGNGIVSSFMQEAIMEPSESLLLNDFIKNLTPMFIENGELRGLFANYVASSEWIEVLTKKGAYLPADYQSGRIKKHTMDGVHSIDHLRYELPTGELFPSASHSVTAKLVDGLAVAEEMDAHQKLFLGHQLRKRQQSMIDTHTSFSSESLQYMICAVLMSSFIQTPAFLLWNDKKKSECSGRYVANHNETTLNLKSLLRTSIDDMAGDATSSMIPNNGAELSGMDADQDNDEDIEVVTVDEPTDIMKSIGFSEESKGALDTDGTATATGYYETLLVHAVAKIDMLALTDTLSTDIWLREVLQYLETLPVALTIADARRHSTGESFPLIYVNHAFEKLTGYHRQEALGRNCHFLQTEERVEMQQVDRIVVALREAQALKVAVTNTRKDGSSFLNFLALRPVHDAEQQYVYVVGILYDVAQAKAGFAHESQKGAAGSSDQHHHHVLPGLGHVRGSSSTLRADHWWHSHLDEHDRLVEDLEGIDALLRLIPMLLV